MPIDVEKKALPPWLDEQSQAMLRFQELPPNWNSYGARPIDHSVTQAAIQLLQDIGRPETPRPEVVPTTVGRVQIEWHVHGIDLEVHVSGSLRRIVRALGDRRVLGTGV